MQYMFSRQYGKSSALIDDTFKEPIKYIVSLIDFSKIILRRNSLLVYDKHRRINNE